MFSAFFRSCRFDYRSVGLGVVTFFVVIAQAISPGATHAKQDSAKALDVVEYQRDAVSPRQVLSGYVLDLNRKELVLDLGTNGRRTIACDQILSVRLNAKEDLVAARQLSLSGKFSEAAEAWERVIRTEKASWLQRYAAMQRCQCQDVAGQKIAAISSFVALAGSDRNEVPWQAAPLVWGRPGNDPILQQQLKAWLKSQDPVQLLLAASLGLQTAGFSNDSRAILQKAAAANDPQVAAIAKMQLWRLENNVSENRLIELAEELNSVPVELQAGGLLVIARLKKNTGKDVEAVADFLRVATLYPDQHSLVLLGLDQAYLTLDGMKDSQAETVGRWLKERFPDSAAAMTVGN